MKYEFTKDCKLIKQYCSIVKLTYKEVLGVDVARMQKHYKKKSNILILKEDNQVVGGAFLIISTPHNNVKLPMETDNFKLSSQLPEYCLGMKSYGEVCRLSLLPEFRNIGIISQIFSKLIMVSLEFNCSYLFSIAPAAQAKVYRIAGCKIDFRIQTRNDIAMPYKSEYRCNRMKLSVLEL